ncbi:MAG: hypothetical protein PUB63_04955 [Clostridia bacterium]|nr:hypothetical protein [Clostridia bacterium]
MTDKHFSSRMLTLAGGLMTLSGILTALLGRLAVGGIFCAAASCLFFAAYHFRLAENVKAKEDPPTDRQKRD